jgi:hypothetical protein
MSDRTEASLVIDLSLRFALFGLECALGVELAAREVERIFADALDDQRSAKDYLLFATDNCRLTGHVTEYEPDTIRLQIEGGSADERLLDNIIERAKYQAMRSNRGTMTA